MRTNTVSIRVWGRFAQFTRPETKPEPLSYDVSTPSASRNIADSVYRHPGFQWEVLRILTHKPIQHVSVMRNEVKQQAVMQPFYADDVRTQRHASMLYDVEYTIELLPVLDSDALSAPEKFGRDVANGMSECDILDKITTIFTRRVQQGQCWQRPYLGTRECAAHFGPATGAPPLKVNIDLGMMLFDMVYERDSDPLSTKAFPVWFPAKLEHGVLTVPRALYKFRRR